MKLTPEIRAGIFTKKGERHYTWPVDELENGLRARCKDCLYYQSHEKPSRLWDGECTSIVANTAPGYVHRKDGKNEFRFGNHQACKFFFWKEEKGEQLTLFAYLKEDTP